MNWLRLVNGSSLNFLARSAICSSTVDIALMSLVQFMLLNYNPNFEASLIQTLDKFSLPYSLAIMGLIRQFSNGTMEMLRLPSPVSLPSVSLGFGYHLRYCRFLFALSVGNTYLTDRDILGSVCPYLPPFEWRWEALPGSRRNLICICHAQRPRSGVVP